MQTDKTPPSVLLALSSGWEGIFSDPVRLADWLIRIAVLMYTVGVAVSIFTRAGSAIGGIALMEWDMAHGQIFLAERIIASILLMLSLSLLIYPTSFALLLLGGVAFAEAYAVVHFGGVPFAEYTPLAHALRFLAPFALIPLVSSIHFLSELKWRVMVSVWVLRIGLACVFFTHGLQALWLDPGFIDLIIGSMRNVFGIAIKETTVSLVLHIIGAVDIVIPSLVLVRPWRPILVWMFFWALITALSRLVDFGFASYPEVLLRASHMIAPIVLWWLIYSEVKEASSKRMADNSSTYI